MRLFSFHDGRPLSDGVELLSVELLEEHARRLAALLSTAPSRRQRTRPPAPASRPHAGAAAGLHRARRGRATRGDVAGGRVAARQLPHHLGRGARHPSRPAALVLPAAAPHRGRRVRRRAPHLRAGARADRIERRPARRAAAAALHQRLPVGHAADDGRAVGVAERAEAGAARTICARAATCWLRRARIGWRPIALVASVEASPDGEWPWPSEVHHAFVTRLLQRCAGTRCRRHRACTTGSRLRWRRAARRSRTRSAPKDSTRRPSRRRWPT